MLLDCWLRLSLSRLLHRHLRGHGLKRLRLGWCHGFRPKQHLLASAEGRRGVLRWLLIASGRLIIVALKSDSVVSSETSAHEGCLRGGGLLLGGSLDEACRFVGARHLSFLVNDTGAGLNQDGLGYLNHLLSGKPALLHDFLSQILLSAHVGRLL